jgi:hypothetical protein
MLRNLQAGRHPRLKGPAPDPLSEISCELKGLPLNHDTAAAPLAQQGYSGGWGSESLGGGEPARLRHRHLVLGYMLMGRTQWHYQRVATHWHLPASTLVRTLSQTSRRLFELTRRWLSLLNNARIRGEILLEDSAYKQALDAYMQGFPTPPGSNWRGDAWSFWHNRRLKWLFGLQKAFYIWRCRLWDANATRALTPVVLGLAQVRFGALLTFP